ncbi:hypothetical protein HKX48_002907 [Thoreauomyces humboldtii]|nr:hypothetical protein HKX48_002907 [Thoreauomyces humboldtii]
MCLFPRYVPVAADDFRLDTAVCDDAIRFVEGDFATYSGYTLVNYKSTQAGLTYFTLGSAAEAIPTPSEMFLGANWDGTAYLDGNGTLYNVTNAAWTTVPDMAGCLDNGVTYFKIGGIYKVFSSGSGTCVLNTGVPVLVATPLYDFSYESLTITAAAADLTSETCFQNGTASYSLNNTVVSPTLNRFSSTSCSNPTIDASGNFSSLPGNCSNLAVNDYANSDSTIVQFLSSSYGCSTPSCIDVRTCLTDSCLYDDGLMAGNVNCTTVDGVAMGMIYVRDPVTSTTSEPSSTTNGIPYPTESIDCTFDDSIGTYTCSGAAGFATSGWTGSLSVAATVGAAMALYFTLI